MDPVYDDPTAYALAYSFRDYQAEADFALRLAARALGRPVTTAVELAAGPAGHARAMAAAGVRCYAVDRSAGAGAYLRRTGAAVTPVTADLCDFVLPEPIDLAICPLGGLSYLLDDGQWQAALARTADALTIGGLLVAEFEVGDAGLAPGPEQWRMESGGAVVEAEATVPQPAGHGCQRWELRLRYEVDGQVTEMVSEQTQRLVDLPLLERLARGEPRLGGLAAYAGYTPRRWRGGQALVVTVVRRER